MSRMPGVARDNLIIERFLRARHQGQSHDLEIEWGDHPAEEFRQRHEEQFGYRMADREIEGVALRVSVTAPAGDSCGTMEEKRMEAVESRVYLNSREGFQQIPRIGQGSLAKGERRNGPLLIEGWTTFSWIPAGAVVEVRESGDLWIEV